MRSLRRVGTTRRTAALIQEVLPSNYVNMKVVQADYQPGHARPLRLLHGASATECDALTT